MAEKPKTFRNGKLVIPKNKPTLEKLVNLLKIKDLQQEPVGDTGYISLFVQNGKRKTRIADVKETKNRLLCYDRTSGKGWKATQPPIVDYKSLEAKAEQLNKRFANAN